MDDRDTEFAGILADCASDDDLQRHIIKHALIVQHLVCYLVKERNHSEARIRNLYANFADMAVEKLRDPRLFAHRTLH
jgi:hypothetical protein